MICQPQPPSQETSNRHSTLPPSAGCLMRQAARLYRWWGWAGTAGTAWKASSWPPQRVPQHLPPLRLRPLPHLRLRHLTERWVPRRSAPPRSRLPPQQQHRLWLRLRPKLAQELHLTPRQWIRKRAMGRASAHHHVISIYDMQEDPSKTDPGACRSYGQKGGTSGPHFCLSVTSRPFSSLSSENMQGPTSEVKALRTRVA